MNDDGPADPAAGWPEPPAAARWRGLVAGVSPIEADPSAIDASAHRERMSLLARWGREVLPPSGGTVLDIGCGDGGASLALVPPASTLVGVDRSGAALDRFLAAPAPSSVARRTVHGVWPEIAPQAPIADLVLCAGVVHDVIEIVPFVLMATMHARLAVVMAVPVRHPVTGWSVASDFVDVLRELGLDPEVETDGVPPTGPPIDPAPDLAAVVARWPGEAAG